MMRKSDIEQEYERACRMVYRYRLADRRTAFWIGYRDALAKVLNATKRKDK